VQGDAEALREARLRQQAARPLGVRPLGRQVRHVGEDARREELRGGRGRALHHALGDGGAVDGHGQRPAHPHVTQRVALDGPALVVGDEGGSALARVVERQVDDAQARHLAHLHALVLAQPRQVGGRDLVDELHIAGQQRGGARAVVDDHAVGHALPVRLLAPVALVALELDAVAQAVGGDAEGAGADGRAPGVEVLRRRVLMRLAVEDADVGQVHRQQRVGTVGAEADGVGVHHDHLADGADHRGEGGGRIGHVGDAADGEGHVLRREGVAVVEGHAAPQAELPQVRLDGGPGFRQARHHPGLRIGVDQPVEDHVRDGVVGRKLVEMRVQAGHRGAHRHGERLRRGRQRHRAGQRQRRKGHAHFRLSVPGAPRDDGGDMSSSIIPPSARWPFCHSPAWRCMGRGTTRRNCRALEPQRLC